MPHSNQPDRPNIEPQSTAIDDRDANSAAAANPPRDGCRAHLDQIDGDGPGNGRPILGVYRLKEGELPLLTTASQHRQWMEDTHLRGAYRCLPMVIANQSGWFVLNEATVVAEWDGGKSASSVKLQYPDGRPNDPHVISHFGSGVLTWKIPLLFRTSSTHNLLVRGPANCPKPGAHPLEGIVESDWAVSSFTMNWMLVDPGRTVRFEKDEPICMLVPQPKWELERFITFDEPILNNPELAVKYMDWAFGRVKFMATRRQGQWQKEYFRGLSAPNESHRTKLHLPEFGESCNSR